MLMRRLRRFVSEARWPGSPTGWDRYARRWKAKFGGQYETLGDEWHGQRAGLETDVESHKELVKGSLIAPYMQGRKRVIDFGSGAGKWTAYLLEVVNEEVWAVDVSKEMVKLLKESIGEHPKLVCRVIQPGRGLVDLPRDYFDGFFSFDCFVHIDPCDIYHYLRTLHDALRPGAVCVVHHSNTLSPVGWEVFEQQVDSCINRRKPYWAFSVNDPSLVRQFVEKCGYEVMAQDTESIPRDCITLFRKPIKS
jgi:SAM-dependent methyltransferase